LTVVESERFKVRLKTITYLIKEDKQSVAVKFAKDLKINIRNLNNSPYKYRKSFYFNDDNIRDMTFKGYTIVYKIDMISDLIIVADIFNRNKP